MNAIAQRLQGLAQDFTRHWPVPGGIITVVTRDKVLFDIPFGRANIERNRAIEPRHLFQIGSISKTFVGIMALRLAEAGKLDLDQPVTRYLPWFKVASAYPMFTTRHLLQHTSGLVAGADAMPDELGQGYWMRELATGSAPGRVFHYSNIAYILLGLLISKVAGQAATTFCQTHILAPLGMSDTLPCVMHRDRPLLAVGYAPAFDDRPWAPGDELSPAAWFEVNGADGNIAASGPDMGRFMRMLLNGGALEGADILTRSRFAELIGSRAPGGEPIVGFLDETGVTESRYGLGINIETIHGNECLTHGGGMVGYSTFMLVDRDNDIGITVLTNANGDCPAAQIIARIGHAWLTGTELASPSVDLGIIASDERMTGSFACAEKEIVITTEKGGLTLTSGGVTGRLFRTWSQRFVTDHPAFRLFHFTFESEAPHWIHGGRIFGRGIASRPLRPHPVVGHYRAHTPWFTNFRIVMRDGRLFLVAPGGVEAPGEDMELVEMAPGTYRIGADDTLPERLVLGPEIDGRVVSVDRDGTRYSRTFTP